MRIGRGPSWPPQALCCMSAFGRRTWSQGHSRLGRENFRFLSEQFCELTLRLLPRCSSQPLLMVIGRLSILVLSRKPVACPVWTLCHAQSSRKLLLEMRNSKGTTTIHAAVSSRQAVCNCLDPHKLDRHGTKALVCLTFALSGTYHARRPSDARFV
jgi:hypothetical protein